MSINYDSLIKQLESILAYRRFTQIQNSVDYKIQEDLQECEMKKKQSRQQRFKQIQSWLGLDKVKKRNKEYEVKNKNKLQQFDFKKLADDLQEYKKISTRIVKKSHSWAKIFDIEENEIMDREREIQLFKLPQQSEEQEFRQMEYFQTMSMHQITVHKAKEALIKCNHLPNSKTQFKYQNAIFKNLKKITQNQEQLFDENDEINQMQFYNEEQQKLENISALVEWEQKQKREEYQSSIRQEKVNNLLNQLSINIKQDINENLIKDIILGNNTPRERKPFVPIEEPIKRSKRMSLQIVLPIHHIYQKENRLSKFYPDRFKPNKSKTILSQKSTVHSQLNSPKKKQSLPKIQSIQTIKRNSLLKSDYLENKFVQIFKGRFKQLVTQMNNATIDIKQQQLEARSIMDNMVSKVREAFNRHQGKLQLEYLKEKQQ